MLNNIISEKKGFMIFLTFSQKHLTGASNVTVKTSLLSPDEFAPNKVWLEEFLKVEVNCEMIYKGLLRSSSR